MVDNPDIEISGLVNDLLNVKNKVAHTLRSPHLLVEVAREHAVHTLHFFVEGGKFSRDLLDKVVVELCLTFLVFVLFLEQPDQSVLSFRHELFFDISIRFAVTEIGEVTETNAMLIIHVDILQELLSYELLLA